MLCSVIYSLLLLTCFQLPATSPPSSFQLAPVFPSGRICGEYTAWQPSSGLGLYWSPKLPAQLERCCVVSPELPLQAREHSTG